MKVESFPNELISFREEVNKHPDLAAKYGDIKDFYELIGAIAADLGIAVDGTYSFYEVLRLLDTLTIKLQERRTLIVRV